LPSAAPARTIHAVEQRDRPPPSTAIDRWTTAAGVGAGFTLAWVVLGLTNSGDAFPQGLAKRLLPIVVIVPGVVGWTVHRTQSKPLRAVIIAAAVLSLAFWVFVRDGWWAVGPS
jgi:hypothetical protein